jgi:hypothetical protein
MRKPTIATAMLMGKTYHGDMTMTPIEITEVWPEFDMVFYRVGQAHFRSAYFNELIGLRYLVKLPKIANQKPA